MKNLKKSKKRVKKKYKIIFIFLLLLVGIGTYFVVNGKVSSLFGKAKDKVQDIIEDANTDKEEKKLKIIDLNSNTRPIAVMINNHDKARPYHSGLQDAYLVYEIIAEGGYTRYMAVYKDKDVAKIGSVRSSRHYYLDYALENDAIYVHWGWSEQAEEDIDKLGVDNINGLTYENTYFYRDNDLPVSLEHRGFTNMELINKAIDKLGYRKTSNKDTLLNYSIEDIDLSQMKDAIPANNIDIRYSGVTTTSYEYDSNAKVYKRSVNGDKHVDYITKEQYTAKNIITYKVANKTISGDKKGRQDLDNLTSGTGYYISNGYAVPINWEKKTRSGQTVYKFQDGKEINVNDGNTYIQIQPASGKLTIE